MTKLKEVKGTVLCEKFADFVMESGNLEGVCCSTYKKESGFYLSDYMGLFKRSKVEIVRYFDLSESTFKKLFFRVNVIDGSNSYFFDINIYLNSEIFLNIADNNGKTLDSYILRFREDAFNSFFNFIYTEEEENASEPEQPAEDAEEQENPEQNKQEFELYQSVEMPLCVFQLMQNQVNSYIDDNDIMEKYGDKEIPCGVVVKIEHNISKPSYKCEIYDDSGEEAEKRISKIEPLSPLERTVFEEIENCFERYNEYAELARTAEYGAEYNGESAEEIARYGHLANEQIFNSDYLKELISQAGLDETYQAWLKERREREQNEISDIEAEENDI